jgi:hypothetical protein
VRAVTLDGIRNVFVLDPTAHTVRVFSPNGKFLAATGRAGRGPGDFADPLALAHDGKETLYVVDRYNGISVFGSRYGKLVYRSRFGAELSPTAACVLGDSLVVAGRHNDRLLHIVSANGNVTRSFAVPFHADSNPLLREVANSGNLVVTCDPARQLLFLAETSGDRVRAYSRKGDLVWEQTLPEFHGSRVVLDRTRPGGFAVILPRFQNETMLPLGTDLLLVQAHHQVRRRAVSREGLPTTTSVDSGIVTYALSARTGRVLTRAYQGPFLASTVAGVTVGYDDEPYPHVILLKATEVKDRSRDSVPVTPTMAFPSHHSVNSPPTARAK